MNEFGEHVVSCMMDTSVFTTAERNREHTFLSHWCYGKEASNGHTQSASPHAHCLLHSPVPVPVVLLDVHNKQLMKMCGANELTGNIFLSCRFRYSWKPRMARKKNSWMSFQLHNPKTACTWIQYANTLSQFTVAQCWEQLKLWEKIRTLYWVFTKWFPLCLLSWHVASLKVSQNGLLEQILC